ncbi:hypothetical protein GQ597_03885 [Gilliamella sp. Pra-s65]|uniref:hypothetical protein n=1 Tax=unclassified Gilliamella TaxID=2685620 RepID=UPI0013662E9B|nr:MULTISPECIES: hypothetical protein [unclassified Gilliamella]MWN89851.1 hypothetical protein [Gilliamella sp. Pra-s65]MWP73023.1 hypothetical protein [Gilliamella sp. Pra-s52]
MDEITKNDIKLEQAEFVNRLMIDTELSEYDIKIGLCLLHELLLKIKNRNDSEIKEN